MRIIIALAPEALRTPKFGLEPKEKYDFYMEEYRRLRRLQERFEDAGKPRRAKTAGRSAIRALEKSKALRRSVFEEVPHGLGKDIPRGMLVRVIDGPDDKAIGKVGVVLRCDRTLGLVTVKMSSGRKRVFQTGHVEMAPKLIKKKKVRSIRDRIPLTEAGAKKGRKVKAYGLDGAKQRLNGKVGKVVKTEGGVVLVKFGKVNRKVPIDNLLVVIGQ